MCKKYRDFIHNFVIWNFITCFLLFPVGIGFSVAYILFYSVGNLLFGEAIRIGFVIISIFMLIFFIAIRILLYSDSLYKKKFTQYFIKSYLVIDVLFSLIVFLVYSCRDIFEIFSSSSIDTAKCIKLLLYVFSVIMLSLLSVCLFKFYRVYKEDQRNSLIKKLYKVYFFLIPLFVVAVFTSTMNFSFYAIHGILENIILGFAVFMCKNINTGDG